MPRIEISPDGFRRMLRERDPIDVLKMTTLSDDEASHVSSDGKQFIQDVIAAKYSIPVGEVKVIIVGSAKLGFSISEKKDDGIDYPRYRPFGPNSDIDIVVVCNRLFFRIWQEISQYSHDQVPPKPWKSKRLGDYLVNGWLRPDHFPKMANLQRCDDWWNCFNRLSRDPRFKRRSVRGGIFFSEAHVQQYYIRPILECREAEEL